MKESRCGTNWGLFITTYDFILSLAFRSLFLFYLLRRTESLLSLLL